MRETKAWQHPPTAGADCDAAYSFKYEDGTQATVEYAAPSRLGSIANARRKLQEVTAEAGKPPRRVVVDRDGNPHVREP